MFDRLDDHPDDEAIMSALEDAAIDGVRLAEGTADPKSIAVVEHVEKCDSCRTRFEIAEEKRNEPIRQLWIDSGLREPSKKHSGQRDEAWAVASAARVLKLRKLASPIQDDPSPAIGLIGKRLGDYRIKSVIGFGGMGTVFRAHHDLLDRDVALKIIHPELANQSKFVERFREELKVAGKLDHPNMVRALSAEQISGVYVLAMELLGGMTIAQWLDPEASGDGPRAPAAGRTFAVPAACDIVAQICRGIEHAHNLGLIHRDIKPSNVILTGGQDGRIVAKVLDLGLARLRGTDRNLSESAKTRVGDLVGTLKYMSPEQAEGSDELDQRTDIYSIGVLLYRMISGRSPYRIDRPGQWASLCAAILRDRPVPITEYCPDIDPALARVIDQALEKSVDDRFQSCSELASALQRWAEPSEYPPTADGPSRHRSSIANDSMAWIARTTPQVNRLKRLSLVCGLAMGACLVTGLASFALDVWGRPLQGSVGAVPTPERQTVGDQRAGGWRPSLGPLRWPSELHYHPAAPGNYLIEVDFRGHPYDEKTANYYFEASPGEYVFRIRPDKRGYLKSDSVSLHFYLNGDSSKLDPDTGEMDYQSHQVVQCPNAPETRFEVRPGTQKISVWPVQWEGEEGARIPNSHTVCVLYCYPDLTFDNAILDRCRVHAGDDFLLNFDIVNSGRDKAGPSVASIALDAFGSPSRGIVQRLEVPGVEPGQRQSVTSSIPVSRFMEAGKYRLTIRIDHGEQVIERDELYLGSWKPDVGRPFLPTADAANILPYNNDFHFDVEVIEPISRPVQSGAG